jgi:hypothetical protein
MKLVSAVAFVASALVASSASAGIVVTSSQAIWNARVATDGLLVETETFNSIADGYQPAPFAGSTASINWSAFADGGLYVQGGVFSTEFPDALTFTFTPGVRAVGGNFFGVDAEFANAAVFFSVLLSDGTSYEGEASSPANFTGFRSTTAATIASLTINVEDAVGGNAVYPSVDNLYFGVTVPAPGAVALLGVAGLVGSRRRR